MPKLSLPCPRRARRLAAGVCLLALTACGGGGGSASEAPPSDAVPRRILFVGNSFTHGRYEPVRSYNSGGQPLPSGGSTRVVDDNDGASGTRAESSEPGPYGGIPGLFAAFAAAAGLDYEVHIEAISSASLQTHIHAALEVIADAKWDAVVLQEQSTKPLPVALANGGNSNPAGFCASVRSLAQSVHAAAPAAEVYLYETWPRADGARALAGDPSSPDFAGAYATALTTLGDAYHDAYYRAATVSGEVHAVAPVGEAWQRAWAQGIAEPNPYGGMSGLPSLWYGIEAVNDPEISEPDRYHPSVYGAYLSALVLFQQVTGVDATSLGADESAAAAIGVPAGVAVQLQQLASQTVHGVSAALRDTRRDPCTAS